MKPLRIFMMVALLALPLLASNTWADFTAGWFDVEGGLDSILIGATTVDKPILGFTIPCASALNKDTLKTLALKSYIERAYSIKKISLWVETNHVVGWQSGDFRITSVNVTSKFETQDSLVISGINRVIRQCAAGIGADTFYITVDANTDYVRSLAYYFHNHGLEVVIDTGYIHLGATSGGVNLNQINNSGFQPGLPPTWNWYKLLFDTEGPQFVLCDSVLEDGCRIGMIDLLDSIQICADTSMQSSNPGDRIKGPIAVYMAPFYGPFVGRSSGTQTDSIFLRRTSTVAAWDTSFRIPDRWIPHSIDADTGYFVIGRAEDYAGNVSWDTLHFNTICCGMGGDKNGPPYWPVKIDTKRPRIAKDATHLGPAGVDFWLCYDKNGDGCAAIGDSICINVYTPLDTVFEIDSVRADLKAYFPNFPADTYWVQIPPDPSENNRVWRKRIRLAENPVEFPPNDPNNKIFVDAWDNACNRDTTTKKFGTCVDLQPATINSVSYFYHTDIDTTRDCIGFGDSVRIDADLTGATNLKRVYCNLGSSIIGGAGIGGPVEQPLYDDGLVIHGDPTASDWLFNLLWEVGKMPIPIEEGKDTNNTVPPPNDWVYKVWVISEDSVGNLDSVRSDRLNRILDSRRPRKLCWRADESLLYAYSKAGGRIGICWPESTAEADAEVFYIYVDSTGGGYDFNKKEFGAVNRLTECSGGNCCYTSEPLTDGKYYRFKIKTMDDCHNVGPESKEVGALSDATPPHVCIAFPDSGLTFGAPFPLKAVADSASHDVVSACLWYRLRPDLGGSSSPQGPWLQCPTKPCMYRPDNGYVFLDTVTCLQGLAYTGWVEFAVKACDQAGNCQDTSEIHDDACLVVDDVFRKGNFIIYWDTLAPIVRVVSVNGLPSPITCYDGGLSYKVTADSLNPVVFNVEGATAGDLFTIDVRGIVDNVAHRIEFRDNVGIIDPSKPCTVWVDIWHWREGTKNLYIHVTDQSNGKKGDLVVPLCVPPWLTPCIKIVSPVEWQRIPCTKEDSMLCIPIWAQKDTNCIDVTVTEVVFQWSSTGSDPWYTIFDDIQPDGNPSTWKACWVNPFDSTWNGKDIYLRAIGYTEFYTADTSYMVKVFVDCQTPRVQLLIEDIVYSSCNHTPKVSGPITLKAVVVDTMVDITEVSFWYRMSELPDMYNQWNKIGDGHPASNQNIWVYEGFNTANYPNLQNHNTDFRVIAKDASGNVMYDSDGDGHFDDATFIQALADGSGWTVFVDNEAPQPAISMVADSAVPIFNVNPSSLLGGSGQAYVKAGDDITAEISVLPSEDTCEVMKVEWYLCVGQQTSPSQGSSSQRNGCVHVGTSTSPYHYPVTFNPITDGLIPAYELEDGWWSGQLMAELYDSLGNVSSDMITLFILDITPTQALMTSPLNESYVWGDVSLRAMALNAYQICKLCYEYKPEGDSVWYPVNGGYPNACITQEGVVDGIQSSPNGGGVPVSSGDNCGNAIEIHIPGDIPFRDMAQTTCGLKDDDNDGCLYAWDGAPDIYYKLIVTQSLDLDIMLDPKGTAGTAMAISTVCPLHGNCMYKSTTYGSSSHGWTDLHLDPGIYYLQIDGRWDGPPCIPNFDLTINLHGFPLDWHTLNTVLDGVYYLRAVATDCDNNVDDNPPTIKVTVANELPTAVIEDPGICKRPCADNPEDTLGYIGGTVTLYATGDSKIDIDHMEFYYKSIFGYPDTWTLIDTFDYFPTNGKYSVEWNTLSPKVADGRYHVKARVYNAAGRYGDSDPITISVDNSGPFSQIISIMGEPVPPTSIDISKGDVIDIELVAIDSTSNDGWTRCYNSGLTSIQVCIENCKSGAEITKCFEVTPVTDGFHTVQWNTSGLEFTGCSGCYYLYVIATDCLGNIDTSSSVTVYVSDITAPVTTIGWIDETTILGYSTEKVKTLLFEYADSGSTNWISIGWSSYIAACGSYYLYMTSWNSASLVDGHYQIRVISHDTCSNQDDSLAPVAYFTAEGGTITPYNPEVLGALSFEKNWCVGGMHGIVRQTCTEGTPVVLAYYGGDYGECVDMQAHLQNTTEYAGSFFATAIDDGGPAEFFSSVTVSTADMGEQYTGEAAYVTYLISGSFDVVQVKRDLGTHGTYQDGCVEVTIPEGAVGSTFQYDRYIWVAPYMMPWVPVTQPNIKPIGDNNGYATYVAFTDCYYCCGWWISHFGGDQGNIPKSPSDGYNACCFNPGATHYAKIKMCYDESIETDKAHLAVMWWDCDDGEFKSDNIRLDFPGVEGFNTEDHTVEFATTCLEGPFAVVELIERPCNGSIVVSMREKDIEPYCNGYTNTMPTFKALVTDNVQGNSAIDQKSIQVKVDLLSPGELIRIYNGAGSAVCDRWMKGFGAFQGAGYDEVSGIFRAGWNDPNYAAYQFSCEGCTYYTSSRYYCNPMYPLAGGNHIATITAMNNNIQTCTDTAFFTVDATKPWMAFADSIGAYVGKNPHFCMYLTDTQAGVDRSSVWMDIFGGGTSSPDPSNHSYIATVMPDQMHWVNDTTVCVDLTFDYETGGYLHIFVYGGPLWKCGASCPNYNYYGYTGGVADCVGNRLDAFWQYYTVDAYGPTITNAYTTLCDTKLKFQITDDMSGVGNVYVYEDSTNKPLIEQDPHNPSYWYYTPSAGPHHVDIRAYDKLGNFTVKSFDLSGDCVPPVVSFIPGYVNCKTPTVKIVVSDAGTGVMWDSVKVDLYYYSNLLETYSATGPNKWTRSGDTITVVGDGARLGISDGYDLYAVVYHEKTGTTSYSKGPKDLAGNWTSTQWIQQSYRADCTGPSITWKNSSTPCVRPIELYITDAKSGVASVKVYQDAVEDPTHLVYDAASGNWLYTPSAGKHTLDVVATDILGNSYTYTFDVKDDCEGPAVAFNTSFVTKNPTIKFTVSDPSGVDWSTVNARVSGCGKECIYLAPELKKHVDMETGEVTLEDCILDCSDGGVVDVWVYSGSSYTGSGPADLYGNYAPNYYRCSYEVDAGIPQFSPSCGSIDMSERPIEICITDGKSGVDWSSLEFYAESETLCLGYECQDTSVTINTDEGCIYYEPGAGRKHVEIRIKDNAGNLNICTFETEEAELFFTKPHNYPNPFDPREGKTTIDLGLSKSAYVTVKIYDFAGEFVRELQQDVLTGTATKLYWDGKTDSGTEVANGTYLCYIHARDDSGATKTAVIKITVLKKDK